MEEYKHGIYVKEEDTELVSPVTGTAALPIVFGTAPINLIENPYDAVNKPILCNDFTECEKQLGYSENFKSYTLCMSMDAHFKVFKIAPVIFVNVLDPNKHVKKNDVQQYTVVDGQALVTTEGILLDTLKVSNGDIELTKDVDYLASFNDNGYVLLTIVSDTAIAAVTVESTSIAPESVTYEDIIGGYDASTGVESGIETVRQVYPRFGKVPGLLLAPGWAHIPTVQAVLAAKSELLNGVFRCENVVDLDTTIATKYTDCKQAKEDAGLVDKHTIVLWPKVKIGEKVYAYSAIYAAMIGYMDANNDDVPNLSPSNILSKVTGTVLEDGTEVVLDQVQANTLNAQGIVTAINDSGWKAWGNNTACYPAVTDPKDRWICCRRFFSWWGNSFILTYKAKVDNPANRVLIDSIVDAENIKGNSYTQQGKCAGAKIEYRIEDNPVTGLLDGHIIFRQKMAPYTPAESIENILSFDPDMLESALS